MFDLEKKLELWHAQDMQNCTPSNASKRKGAYKKMILSDASWWPGFRHSANFYPPYASMSDYKG
jgi:hypothetical protein